MQCPKCHADELVQARSKHTGVTVDHCPQCKGMWCDRGELERMLDVVVSDLEVPRNAELSTKKCPKCARRLRALPYRSTLVTVDTCLNCTGIWLDGGELQKLRERRAFIQKDVRTARNAPARPTPLSAAQSQNSSTAVPGTPQPKGAKRTLISMINEAIDNLSRF